MRLYAIHPRPSLNLFLTYAAIVQDACLLRSLLGAGIIRVIPNRPPVVVLLNYPLVNRRTMHGLNAVLLAKESHTLSLEVYASQAKQHEMMSLPLLNLYLTSMVLERISMDGWEHTRRHACRTPTPLFRTQ